MAGDANQTAQQEILHELHILHPSRQPRSRHTAARTRGLVAMTGGPDFGYGSQPGEYGDISDFGYGAQPGEYGVDTAHGVVTIVRDQAYGTNQGPSPTVSRTVPSPPSGRKRSTRARRVRSARSLTTVLAAAVAVAGLVVGYRCADTTSLRVRVSASPHGDHREVVDVHLDGTLGWSKRSLTVAVVDRTVGRPLRIVRTSALCAPALGGTTIRAPRNQPIHGDCTVVVRVPRGRLGDHGAVVLSVDGRRRPGAGFAVR